MPRFVAFLRVINVGNGRAIKMDSLRQPLETLGFSEVETFMASGNVVFETRTKDTKTLETKFEKKLREALGYEVAVFIRTIKKLKPLMSHLRFARPKRSKEWLGNTHSPGLNEDSVYVKSNSSL
jgi:uncharacterized protein (DUF1697 family)